MSHNCNHNREDHVCESHCSTSSLYQTLDELDFERGIWYAAQYGDVEKTNKLLKQGTSANCKDLAGYTALHYAARNGHLDICKILLDNGADINVVTKAGCASALHRACSAGKLQIVKFLLENKANVELKDGDGKTALHRAAESQNKAIFKILVDFRPFLENEVDNKGKIAAHYFN